MKLSVTDMVLIALFSVLLAVCAWISIPAAVPFTLQTLGLFITMGLLGGKRSVLTVLTYLLMGAIGIPVFSGFRGGFSMLMGITGGYLIGFVFAALVYWLITARSGGALWPMILGMVTGMLMYYAFGTAWFMLFYARAYGAIGLWSALSMCVIPFLIPDLIKLGLAVTVVRALPKRVKTLSL